MFARLFLNVAAILIFSSAVVAADKPIEQCDSALADSNYIDKAKGFWLGQNIANWTGLITEMDTVGTLDTMPFYTDADWGAKDRLAMGGEYVPHSNVIDFYVEEEGGVWGADDDTDIEYMYLHQHFSLSAKRLSKQQIQQAWLTHTYSNEEAPLFKKFPESTPIKENFLWESNEKARILMAQGMLPPETSLPANNSKSRMIDSQLTTEMFGLLALGKPELALKIAELPIRVSAYEASAQIARFYVVMHALLEQVPDQLTQNEKVIWLAHKAKFVLNHNDYPAKMFNFVWRHYLQNPDKNNWELTRDAVFERYQKNSHDGYVYQEPFDAGINFAASLVSLFYGQGDYKRTVKIGTLTGWDSDNPTATWGGLLGFMFGENKIRAMFPEQRLSEKYWIHRTRRNFPDYLPNEKGEDTFSLMAQRMYQVHCIVVH